MTRNWYNVNQVKSLVKVLTDLLCLFYVGEIWTSRVARSGNNCCNNCFWRGIKFHYGHVSPHNFIIGHDLIYIYSFDKFLSGIKLYFLSREHVTIIWYTSIVNSCQQTKVPAKKGAQDKLKNWLYSRI